MLTKRTKKKVNTIKNIIDLLLFILFVEIPYLTVKSDEEYSKIREKLRWKPTNYKIVQFSINDLLRAEKIENTNRFLFKDTDFRSVKIKGSIVGKENRSTGTLIRGSKKKLTNSRYTTNFSF